MRNQTASVARRLSDPDFQGTLVNRCLALTLGMGVAARRVAAARRLGLDPSGSSRDTFSPTASTRRVPSSHSTVRSSMTPSCWNGRVKAILAPYNVDYYNYPVELNTASRRFTVRGWNTFAQLLHLAGQFRRIEARAAAVPRTVAARGGDSPDELRPRRARLRRSRFRSCRPARTSIRRAATI